MMKIHFRVRRLFLFFILTEMLLRTSFAAVAPPLPAHPGSKVVTKEKLLSMSLDLDVSPKVRWIDNKQFLYQLPSPSSAQKASIQLYNIDSKKSEFLVEGENPVASPDGQWIAFARGDGAEKQLWRIRLADKKLEQVSHLENGLSGCYMYTYEYIWSPDSKRMILSHQEYLDPTLPKNKNKPQLKAHLDLIDLETGKSEPLATIDARLGYLSWISKTEEILFVKERLERFYHDGEDQEVIAVLNTETHQSRELIKIEGLQQCLNPIASHDGKTVIFKTDVKNPTYSYILNLCTIPTNTDVVSHPMKMECITNLDLKVSENNRCCWSHDDQSVMASCIPGPYAQLYKIDPHTHQAKQLTFGALNLQSFDLSLDGKHLVLVGIDAHGERAIKIASSDGSNVEDVITQPLASENTALSEVREIEWSAEDYPMPIRGLLVMPLHYEEGKKYPLIVDIHGADVGASLSILFPYGGMFLSAPLEWQMWAARDYAVFVPDFRSSGCFGSLAIDRDLLQNHDRLGGDLRDIEAGVDWIIANGIADPDRMAVVGHSAGGLRANWFEVSTHRYKAIVSHEGWADELEMALNEPDTRRDKMSGGSPQDVPENYIKNSPLYFADQATTPILFLMGNPELGGADPYHAVFKFYEALKKNGVEAECHAYSDEGHCFEKLENRKDFIERTVSWIERHFGKSSQ